MFRGFYHLVWFKDSGVGEKRNAKTHCPSAHCKYCKEDLLSSGMSFKVINHFSPTGTQNAEPLKLRLLFRRCQTSPRPQMIRLNSSTFRTTVAAPVGINRKPHEQTNQEVTQTFRPCANPMPQPHGVSKPQVQGFRTKVARAFG